MIKQFVVYKRLSKAKVEGSSYGFDAQEHDINQYLKTVGEHEVIAEFGEFYSGGKSHTKRVEFSKALKMCEDTGATLLVSKIDRASRNVASLATIMERVNLEVATMIGVDPLTYHVMASFAEFEYRAISSRTKAALQVAKARGVKLGGKRAGTKNNGKATLEKTKALALKYSSIIGSCRNTHKMTLAQTAEHLNQAGLKTVNGGGFQQSTVHTYIKHIKSQGVTI